MSVWTVDQHLVLIKRRTKKRRLVCVCVILVALLGHGMSEMTSLCNSQLNSCKNAISSITRLLQAGMRQEQ